MKNKSLIILALFSLLLVLPLVSAEIIWSFPTGVDFFISGNSTTNQSLIVNVISPQSRTYSTTSNTLNLPLKVESNLESTCWYQLNNQAWVSLGVGKYFSKTLSLNSGNYNLKVLCHSGTQEVIKEVNFKVNCNSNKNQTTQLEIDEAYEQLLKQTTYGDWICINNKLQRDVTYQGLTQVEYGQLCGVELGPKDKLRSLSSNWLLILPLILFILILIIIILVALALSRDN